jgi:S1-C subfamily serine protease
MVSARHAALLYDQGRWRIRDLGSRNGTFLNGRLIEDDVELSDGDRIIFGAGGPLAEFRIALPGTESQPRKESTTQRLRAQLSHQAARLRVMVVALAALVGLVALGFTYVALTRHHERLAWDRERDELMRHIDSVFNQSERAVVALEGERQGLTDALQDSQNQLARLRDQLRRAHAGQDRAEVTELRRELQNVAAALERQQLAAGLDFHGIGRRNSAAVALVFAEAADGTLSTGTAFAVRADATLLTARHLVVDEERRPARRLAIQFAGSTQVWPARLLAASADSDLAVVKVDQIVGDVPTIQALNTRPDTLVVGTPVALLGFPLGGQTVRPGRTPALPLLTAAVITGSWPDRLQLQGYGATGASGSPVLDANGEVVGVVFGGAADRTARAVLAIPAPLAARLLVSIGSR